MATLGVFNFQKKDSDNSSDDGAEGIDLESTDMDVVAGQIKKILKTNLSDAEVIFEALKKQLECDDANLALYLYKVKALLRALVEVKSDKIPRINMQTYLEHTLQAKKAIFIMREILTAKNVISENIALVVEELNNGAVQAGDINLSLELESSIEAKMNIIEDTGASANKNTSHILEKTILPLMVKTQSQEILELAQECIKMINSVLTRHYKHAMEMARTNFRSTSRSIFEKNMRKLLKQTIETEVIWIGSMLPEANPETYDKQKLLLSTLKNLFELTGKTKYDKYQSTLEDIYDDGH